MPYVKPATTEEALAHFGKKGMKWGVRNTRPTGKQILSARGRQEQRRRDFAKATTSSQKAKISKDFHTNEDRVTASRMTKGEKIATTLVGGPIGALLVIRNISTVKRTARLTDAARAEKK